ncbi:pilus assembly protein TadG-related protein [Muricoccus radiodurans]|uniref:pilus assembly protein TadG-related protein n=1 Tax=Muricoccus radiodurans TaxID=2231721 RepID=UPI003CF614B2
MGSPGSEYRGSLKRREAGEGSGERENSFSLSPEARARLGHRGNVAVMTALLSVPLVAMAGVATDAARAWALQSRLYTALDAAAIAMARNIGSTAAARNAEAAGVFWANFTPPGGAAGAPIGTARTGFLNSVATFQQPVLVGTDSVQIAATATIPAYFTRLIGWTDITVSGTSQARRADQGLELALVLDVTGSMDTGCSTPSDRTGANCGFTTLPTSLTQTVTGRSSNMDLLRLAAADLVNTLYGDRTTVPNLWVSVVPYTTTINIGPGRSAFLDATSRANLSGDFAPTTWRGCVEARVGYAGAPADGDMVDYAPSDVAFRPFLYRSTYDQYTLLGLPLGLVSTAGDNDWVRILWRSNTFGQNAITEDYQLWRGNQQVGPNVGCPQVPVLPLTADKATVLATISALRPTFRGGTMGNLGLLGGWFTLSPRWRSAWNLGPAPVGQVTPLPLDYNTRYMRKAIVMMTDGNNNWYDSPHGYPGDCHASIIADLRSFPTAASGTSPPGPAQFLQPEGCPIGNLLVGARSGAPPIANNADYTGYGRPSDNRVSPSAIDSRMATLCTRIKAAGITIYTVVLNTGGAVDSSTQTLYRNCASATTNFFLVSQPTQLRPAFQQIGQQLANLRIIR